MTISSLAALGAAGKLEVSTRPVSDEFRKMLDSRTTGKANEDKLEAYVKMTPAERMREAILKKLDLDEEKLSAMGPEERKAVDQQINDLMKEALEKSGEKKGGNVDVTV